MGGWSWTAGLTALLVHSVSSRRDALRSEVGVDDGAAVVGSPPQAWSKAGFRAAVLQHRPSIAFACVAAEAGRCEVCQSEGGALDKLQHWTLHCGDSKAEKGAESISHHFQPEQRSAPPLCGENSETKGDDPMALPGFAGNVDKLRPLAIQFRLPPCGTKDPGAT